MDNSIFIVSLDFDGVLAHGLNLKLKYAKEWFGVDLNLNQTKEKGFNELMIKLGKPFNYRSLMDKLNEDHIMEFESPFDCKKALDNLFNKNFRFVIITSRNNHDYPYAVAYVEKNFGKLIEYIHNTKNEPKDKFAKRIKPRIHVDDDLSKLIQLLDCPVELIYFRQPENNGIEIPKNLKNRIWEVSSFSEIEAIAQYIKKIHSNICEKYNIENNWRNIAKIFELYHKLKNSELVAV
jgi:hypothetical protein